MLESFILQQFFLKFFESFWNHNYLGMEWVFVPPAYRNLNDLFVVVSGLKPDLLATLLAEFWDFYP